MGWFRRRTDEGNGSNGQAKPMDAGLLAQLLDERGPVSFDDLRKMQAVEPNERARLILELKESPGYHALICEVLAAAETASQSDKGDFVGASELLGCLRVIFAIARNRIGPEDSEGGSEENSEGFLRKMLRPVIGKRGNRQFRGMTEYSVDEWEALVSRAKAIEKREKAARRT
jgi:hypothetical protein